MGIGENLKKIRKALNLTQEDFAQELGSSQSAISEYEKGVKTPSLKVAQKIVKFAKTKKVKVTLNDIFPEE